MKDTPERERESTPMAQCPLQANQAQNTMQNKGTRVTRSPKRLLRGMHAPHSPQVGGPATSERAHPLASCCKTTALANAATPSVSFHGNTASHTIVSFQVTPHAHLERNIMHERVTPFKIRPHTETLVRGQSHMFHFCQTSMRESHWTVNTIFSCPNWRKTSPTEHATNAVLGGDGIGTRLDGTTIHKTQLMSTCTPK